MLYKSTDGKPVAGVRVPRPLRRAEMRPWAGGGSPKTGVDKLVFNIGFQELIIIAIIALLIVGPKKLPELAKSLGKGFSELRRAADDITDDVKNTFKEDEKPDDDGLKNSLLLKKSDNNESNPETLDKTKKESETSSE